MNLTPSTHEHHHRYRRRSSRQESDEERTKYIIETFLRNFADDMRENPKGWRSRFRKMAENEFAFYRGSAVLFYRDMQEDARQDRWLSNCQQASRIFIHGDLHAENFGTYIDRYGVINFDVNDFDEGYLGPFIWDVKRLVASVNLITFSKAYSDEKITHIIGCLVRAYLNQIYEYCNSSKQRHVGITTENTEGPVNILLKESRLGSKEEHLDKMTVVENYERKFIRSKTMKDVDPQLRHQIALAFQDYLRTIPESKKDTPWPYKIKDIVSRTSPGIGSAGRTSYSLLIQGKNEALENDVVLYMTPATSSAVASVIHDPNLQRYFQHDGLRTVLCAYAMHAVASKWLGYTTLNNQIPMVVDEVATHSKDLQWDNINDMEEVCQTAEYLGKAMAKIHCISDIDSIKRERHGRHHTDLLPLDIIPHHTERTIRDAIQGNNDAFIQDMVAFAMYYGNRVRRDHRLFFEAFRNERIPILNMHQVQPKTSTNGSHSHQ